MNEALEVEAVLAEDGRTIVFYSYRGEGLVRVESQSLPIHITNEAFEDVRGGWQTAWANSPPLLGL